MLINNKRLSILNIGGEFSLIPGVNRLPQKFNSRDWDNIAQKYPKVRYLLDQGELEVVDDGDDEPQEDEQFPNPFHGGRQKTNRTGINQSLEGLSDRDAIRLVRETADDKLLAVWHDAETRPPVIAAIEKQFDALAKAGESK